MTSSITTHVAATYTNPVYDRPCADPFVLKWCGTYWAYCSGTQADGRCFGILRSSDLIHWHKVGSALDRLPEAWDCYWAPEVTYLNGQFYMYYSAGDEEHMQIRVAVADHPDGPFIDSGRRLTSEQFAIDAHVFEDVDGSRWLFYATDYLEHTHIGTGTAVDRLIDPWTLAGQPRPVTRARYDWQIYDPQRAAKGGVRWHTVEGSFVLRHKGRLYQMFSGGNWQNPSYGVSYAISDTIDRSDEWEQHANGDTLLPILRTIPGSVIGPGHNSVVRGPDNQQLFCVYHRWALDGSDRIMAIDRLEWVGERMLIVGPSTTPQPVPIAATQSGFNPDRGWCAINGAWEFNGGEARQRATQITADARHELGDPCWIMEISLRADDDPTGSGSYGVGLYADHTSVLQFVIEPGRAKAILGWRDTTDWRSDEIDLPRDFVAQAYHLLRLELNGSQVTLRLDNHLIQWSRLIAQTPDQISLLTHEMAASFAGWELTVGWQDTFMDQMPPTALGWQPQDDHGRWTISDQTLHGQPTTDQPSVIVKGAPLANYELVVNLRAGAAADGGYGLYPAWQTGDPGPLLLLDHDSDDWTLHVLGATAHESYPLPSFDPHSYTQLRVRKHGGQMVIQREATVLGTIAIDAAPATVALRMRDVPIDVDLVRLTAIND